MTKSDTATEYPGYRQEPVWQPMETAPRDGTTILAHIPKLRGYTARQDVVPVHWSGWGGGTWENSTSGSKLMEFDLSHWMPLPPPPQGRHDGESTSHKRDA